MENQRKYKILVADDEKDVREVFVNSLRNKHHMDVRDAEDGVRAIEIAKEFCPDLIFLDIRMPQANGWEVIGAVRKFNSTVKFIIITGWATMTLEEHKIVTREVAAYIEKPVVLNDAIKKMFEVLGEEFKPYEVDCKVDLSQGREEVREVVHALANIHSRIRMQCDYFVSNYEDGYFKDRSEAGLLEESVKILKDIIAAVDDASPKVEAIRKL